MPRRIETNPQHVKNWTIAYSYKLQTKGVVHTGPYQKPRKDAVSEYLWTSGPFKICLQKTGPESA